MKIFKITTFVPVKDADKLRKAIGDTGAGVLGNYTHCSFSSRGIGRFIPQKGAHPTIGEMGKPEEVEEEKVEVVCEEGKVKKVIRALRKAHPYEEAPVEIWPLINEEEFK